MIIYKGSEAITLAFISIVMLCAINDRVVNRVL